MSELTKEQNLLNTLMYDNSLTEKDYEENLEKFHGFELGDTEDKRKMLRNCVNPKLGLFIFNEAFKVKQETLVIE